jgi:hypothetical protein
MTTNKIKESIQRELKRLLDVHAKAVEEARLKFDGAHVRQEGDLWIVPASQLDAPTDVGDVMDLVRLFRRSIERKVDKDIVILLDDDDQ